ncbi:MAG: tRNA (guanosine(37)-N1)-methyltransferase TrmD [Alkalispirochaetaceae bacterium]
MRITVLTIFPEFLEEYFRTSIMGRAVSRALVEPSIVDIREFARDKHRSVDDAPYGGGAGMVLMPGPLSDALDSVEGSSRRVVYATPSGTPLTQGYARELAGEDELIFISGRYEGIDQRVIDSYVDDEISIGDYVVASGELAVMVIIDAVFRLREGVITRGSLDEESFDSGLLEYPHYTRPEEFRGMRVPEVLLSGHHERIRRWRRERQIEKTRRVRPDLLGPEHESEGRRKDGSDKGS